MKNMLSWFEIFVGDMKRAQAFYEQMLGVSLKGGDFNGEPHAIFQAEGLAGALVVRKGREPNPNGALIYLNCDGKLDACVARVTKAGGKVLLPKTDIGDPGFIAIVVDTEGNQVGLHSERH